MRFLTYPSSFSRRFLPSWWISNDSDEGTTILWYHNARGLSVDFSHVGIVSTYYRIVRKQYNRVQFLRTFIVFLCKKTDKLLATKSSAVTRYVVFAPT